MVPWGAGVSPAHRDVQARRLHHQSDNPCQPPPMAGWFLRCMVPNHGGGRRPVPATSRTTERRIRTGRRSSVPDSGRGRGRATARRRCALRCRGPLTWYRATRLPRGAVNCWTSAPRDPRAASWGEWRPSATADALTTDQAHKTQHQAGDSAMSQHVRTHACSSMRDPMRQGVVRRTQPAQDARPGTARPGRYR